MKISVVIPAYNEELYIGPCLESLLNQQEKPDEIIVVNNNSTDRTVEIAKNYPVRIINEPQQGMIQARNRGFNEAKYEIIARTDADTILPPTWIKNIKKKLENQKIIALSGPAKFYDLPEFAQNDTWKTQPTWLKIIKSYNKIVRKLLKHDCLYGPNCILRKRAWEKIKDDVCLNDKLVHEDLDLAIHLAPLGIVKFDNSFVVQTSVRRWKKPESYFNYLLKVFKSIAKHEQKKTKLSGKHIVKQLVNKTFVKIPKNIDNL